MKRYPIRILLPVLAACLLLLAGCQTDAGSPVTRNTSSGFALGDGDFNLIDPTAGLSNLTAYTATLTQTFEGKQGGAAVNWTRTYTMHADTQVAARQFTFVGNPGGEAATWTGFELNGVQYLLDSGGVCSPAPLAEAVPLTELWEPAALLPALTGANSAGEVTIAGTPVQQYTFDERALGQSGLTTASGKVSLATNGGAIVQYTLTQKGDDAYFGEGTEGTLTWDYQLSAINELQNLALPPACITAAVLDVPVPADASEVSQSEVMVSFMTPQLPENVVAFYAAALPALGWQSADNLEGMDAAASDTSGGVLASYTRGGERLTLLIAPEASATSVQILYMAE